MPEYNPSHKPWIDAYEPREWKVYTFDLRDVENHPLRKKHPEWHKFIMAAAESHKAESDWKHWEGSPHAIFFYYDMEQIMAGMDKVHGMVKFQPEVLFEDWNGHPKGALVVQLYGPDRFDTEHEGPAQTIFMVEVL